MTNEAVLNCINEVLISDLHYDESLGYQLTSDDIEWLEKAKEAVQKQVPQKLKRSGKYGVCPNCSKLIERYEQKHGNIEIPHCKWCGKKLNWSET